MKMRTKIHILLLAFSVMAVCFIFMYGRLMTHLAASIYKLDISYADVRAKQPDLFFYKDITILDKKTGAGLRAKSAEIILKFAPWRGWIDGFDFRFADMSFVESKKNKPGEHDAISALALLPFSENWRYGNFSGEVRTTKTTISIKNLSAESDEIRLFLNGEMVNDSQFDIDANFFFADTLISKIPPELTSLVLESADNGWKKFPVTLKGDYKIPSINVSSKRFRLNISPK